MKTPAFRHMGGKARLRKWLVQRFPDNGKIYLEPFAGKGNVFFWARQQLQFERWVLSDIDVRFLRALTQADFSLLPKTVNRDDFNHWRTQDCDVSKLIEPRVTFAGKGYKYGYSGSSGTHVGYSGPTYRKVCERARELLGDAQIVENHWEDTLNRLGGNDFVYLDPPYHGTEASYQNIDHARLVEALNNASFSWALSGYRNPFYDTRLIFRCRFEYERNSEIKSSNSRSREPVIETLWTNYDL